MSAAEKIDFSDLVLFIMRRDGLSPHAAIAHALTINKKDRKRLGKTIFKSGGKNE